MKQLIAKLKRVEWELVGSWVVVCLLGIAAAVYWGKLLFLEDTYLLPVAILLTLAFIAFLIPLWIFSSTIREHAKVYDACEKYAESMRDVANAIEKTTDKLQKKIDQSQC